MSVGDAYKKQQFIAETFYCNGQMTAAVPSAFPQLENAYEALRQVSLRLLHGHQVPSPYSSARIHHALPRPNTAEIPHTQGYRSSPYGASPKNTGGRGRGTFKIQRETIDVTSPDAELARRDPLYHYVIRTGKHRSHISRFDEQYVGWISGEHYRHLSRDHIIRRAIDKWNAERRASGALPPVQSAPPRFENGKYHLYMQEKYLNKWWKVSPQGLIDAGVEYKVNENIKTKAKKFSLYQLYEYVKKHDKLSRDEVELMVEEEKNRIPRTRATYKSYQSGEFSGGGGDFEDFYDYPF